MLRDLRKCRVSNGKVEPQPSTSLAADQVAMIEEALAGIRDFGEVQLIVHKGRLRYLVMQRSYDALHWEPTSRESQGGSGE